MSGPTIKVHFVKEGDVVTQFNFDEKYQLLITFYDVIKDSNVKVELKYGNDLGILMVRMAVLRGVIPHENVVFIFENHRIGIGKDARLTEWPEGFCDIRDILLEELLGWTSLE